MKTIKLSELRALVESVIKENVPVSRLDQKKLIEMHDYLAVVKSELRRMRESKEIKTLMQSTILFDNVINELEEIIRQINVDGWVESYHPRL
jgi:hypothetical protein